MLLYDYICEKDYQQFSLKDLGITSSDPIPKEFIKDGKMYHRVHDRTALFVAEDGDQQYVNSIEYELEMGEPLGDVVYINDVPYKYGNTVLGIPYVADLDDTMARLHDTKRKVNFTKPPLQAEKSFGYGLT